MTDPKTLAASLRAMHEARTRHFTTTSGVHAFSIVATEERMGDLLAAADALERETAARQRAQIERHDAIAAREHGHDHHIWRSQLRAAIQTELAERQDQPAAALALAAVAELMGVDL